MNQTFGDAFASFYRLVEGGYSLCSVGLTNENLSDLDARQLARKVCKVKAAEMTKKNQA